MTRKEAHQVPTDIHRWSTTDVSGEHPLEAWMRLKAESTVATHVEARHADKFHVEVGVASAGPLTLTSLRASAHSSVRTADHVARGEAMPVLLVSLKNAPWRIQQGGSVCHCQPGDAVLYDSAEPFVLDFPEPITCFVAVLPRLWLGRWLTDVDHRGPRKLPRGGWAATLSTLCGELAEDITLVPQYPEGMLCDHMGSLLAAALAPPVEANVHRGAALVDRAATLIKEQLACSGLTATAVALELGVSARTLHRSFLESGSTFALTLRDLRMAHARELLSARRFRHLSTAAIGVRCGYPAPEHFCRVFHAACGVTPAVWRRLHQ